MEIKNEMDQVPVHISMIKISFFVAKLNIWNIFINVGDHFSLSNSYSHELYNIIKLIVINANSFDISELMPKDDHGEIA